MSDLLKKNTAEIVKTPAVAGLQQFIAKKKEEQVAEKNPLQMAFAFDTTGSTYNYFETGKNAIHEIVRQIIAKGQKAVFNYIAFKNHGDEEKYFDGHNPYFATRFLDSADQIKSALAKIQNGGGGDGLSAIEDVLYHLAREVNWLPLSKKALVLIGDMPPHGVIDSISRCPREIDYKNEVAILKSKGVKIYSVWCYEEIELLSNRKQKIQEFYKWIANETGGKYLELSEITDLVDIMVGVCMKETGHWQDFVKTIQARKQLTSSSRKFLAALEDKR